MRKFRKVLHLSFHTDNGPKKQRFYREGLKERMKLAINRQRNREHVWQMKRGREQIDRKSHCDSKQSSTHWLVSHGTLSHGSADTIVHDSHLLGQGDTFPYISFFQKMSATQPVWMKPKIRSRHTGHYCSLIGAMNLLGLHVKTIYSIFIQYISQTRHT